MPGTLFVVATPIGHLEDITLRALRTLREVAVIAAEDTRRTAKLLRHYGIETPLVSLHEHNEQARGRTLVARLLNGEDVALVSDAGTPGISDPGALFVSQARAEGIAVYPVPGPSIVTAVLSASGLSFDRFAFAGFAPIRLKDRNNWLAWVAQLSNVPVVCLEAPHRIVRTLKELRTKFVNRQIILARELTKVHEEWHFIPAQPVPEGARLEDLVGELTKKGEFAIVICPAATDTSDAVAADDEQIAATFGQVTKNERPLTRRAAVKEVARRLHLPARTVYAALERAKAVNGR